MNVNFFWIIQLFLDLFQIQIFGRKIRKGIKTDENGRRNEYFHVQVSDILVLKDIDSVLLIVFILKISRFQARTAWVPLLAARFLHKCKKATIVNKVRTIFIFQIFASFGVTWRRLLRYLPVREVNKSVSLALSISNCIRSNFYHLFHHREHG